MSRQEDIKGANSTVEKIVDHVSPPALLSSKDLRSTNAHTQADVAEIKVVKGSEAYNEALMKEAPKLWHPTTLKLFGCLLLGCFAQTMVSQSYRLNGHRH
jgi:hypothetical protein